MLRQGKDSKERFISNSFHTSKTESLTKTAIHKKIIVTGEGG